MGWGSWGLGAAIQSSVLLFQGFASSQRFIDKKDLSDRSNIF